jgi:hypothetical protein
MLLLPAGQPNSVFVIILIIMISASYVPVSTREASAECQPDAPVPALKLITEIEHYSFADEYVTILGQIRKDVIIEGQAAALLISRPDGSVQSQTLPVHPVGGNFVHSMPLDITDEKRFGRYNVTAEYGAYVANWSFNVSPGIVDFGGSSIGNPKLHTANGDAIVEGKVSLGQQVVISTEFRNPWDWRDQPVVVIIEVRDSDGVTVFFGLQSRVLKPDCGAEFGVSWLASEQGNFQVRSFALTSLETPSLLSPVMSTDVVVLESGVELTNAGASHVIDTPLNFSDFKKIDMKVTETTSINPNLEMEAVVDPVNYTISFRVANTGSAIEELQVDHWRLNRSIGGGSQGDRIDQTEPMVVPPDQYVEITRAGIEFDPYETPGRTPYGFDLEGFNWDEELQGNNVDFGIAITVLFDYGANAISRLDSNQLLHADNLLLLINGTGDPFEFDDGNSRKVEIYLANSGQNKIGSEITGFYFSVWPLSEPRFRETMSGTADGFGNRCEYLEPGERKAIDGFAMAKTYWPIERIAQKLDSSGSPEVYIFHYLVHTRSCSLSNGEYVAGGNRLLVAAFDAR